MLSANFVWVALDWSLGCMQVAEQLTLGSRLFGLEVRLWIPSPRSLYFFKVGESQLLVGSLRNI